MELIFTKCQLLSVWEVERWNFVRIAEKKCGTTPSCVYIADALWRRKRRRTMPTPIAPGWLCSASFSLWSVSFCFVSLSSVMSQEKQIPPERVRLSVLLRVSFWAFWLWSYMLCLSDRSFVCFEFYLFWHIQKPADGNLSGGFLFFLDWLFLFWCYNKLGNKK